MFHFNLFLFEFPCFDSSSQGAEAVDICTARTNASLAKLCVNRDSKAPVWVEDARRFARVSTGHSGASLSAAVALADNASNDVVKIASDLFATLRDMRIISKELLELERTEAKLQSKLKVGKESDQMDRMRHQIEMLDLRSLLGKLLTEKATRARECDALHKSYEALWGPRRDCVAKLRVILQDTINRKERLLRLNYSAYHPSSSIVHRHDYNYVVYSEFLRYPYIGFKGAVRS